MRKKAEEVLADKQLGGAAERKRVLFLSILGFWWYLKEGWKRKGSNARPAQDCETIVLPHRTDG